nr:putative quinol monooxygenase [Pseudomonas sp. PCH44]
MNLKQKERPVYSLFIKTRVQAGCAEAFLAAIKVNAAASVATEPGCLVFDVSQDRMDPDVIYLYEIYRDDNAYEAHTQTAHFRDSRPLVEPLIVEQECFESNVIARNPVH